MFEESIAEQRAERLRRNYAAEMDRLNNSMGAEPGWPQERLIWLQEDQVGRRHLLEAGGMTPGLWRPVQENLSKRWIWQRSADRLVFHDFQHDQFSATCSVESDESGLVMVSDGLLGKIVQLSRLLAYCSYAGGHSSPLGRARLISTLYNSTHGRLTKRQARIFALLRYTLIHQRCFGLHGVLDVRLTPAEEEYAISIFHSALSFVLAHEAGHFVLGHPTAAFSLIGDEEIPLISDNEALELEADAFAYETVSSMMIKAFGSVGDSMALIGSGIALLGIFVIEQGCFVRRTRTHPPADMRWSEVCLKSSASAKDAIQAFISIIKSPAQAAVDSQRGISRTEWNRMFQSGDVIKTSHNREALGYTPVLDQLLTAPLEELPMEKLGREHENVIHLDRATIDVDKSVIEERLRRIGMQDRDVADITQPRVPMTFHGLLNRLKKSLTVADISSGDVRLFVGCIAARRLTPAIQAITSDV